MKKNKKKTFVRITAVVLALLMVVPMIISAFATVAYGAEITYVDDNGKKYKLTDFRDTQGHWAQAQIKAWANYQIIKGYNGNFMPDDEIKRCDIACIIDRLMGLSYTSYNSFRDLQPGEYYTESMLKCYAAGFIKGDEKNLRPLDTATREEVATILFRVFAMETDRGKSFIDSGSISSWAVEEVSTMASKGYIKGYPDGSFGPQNNITRAELITMLDNIISIYITSAVKSADSITADIDGNVINTKKGMIFSRSNLGANLYCTQSCTGMELVDTEISGTIYLLSDKFSLKLTNSTIPLLYTNATATINGAENIEVLHVTYEGSGTVIDDMPSRIILEPNASITIGRAVYANESNKVKEYDSEEIYQDLAEEGYKLNNSPTISLSKLDISADNIVSFESLRPGQSGSGELKSFGILMMEGTSIPTLDDYDDKISYRASYIDDYYRENGGTRGRIADEVGKQEDGTTYTYVPYALNYGGMITYGEPVILKAYDFIYNMSLLDTGNYPESLRVVMTLEGSNIPKISSVLCYYDTTPAYVSERNYKAMTLMRITDTDTRYQDTVVGERVLYSCVINGIFDRKTNTYTNPSYFGYKISFADGAKSVYSEFPSLMNAVPEVLSPLQSIETGYTSTSKDIVVINENKIKTLNTIVNEYGVVYSYTEKGGKPSEDKFDNSWNFMADGNSISLNSEEIYDVSLNIDGDKDIHYAAYVKTVEGYYFGDVKTYNISDSGVGNISTSINYLILPDDSLVAVIDSELTSPDVVSSKIVKAVNSNGDEISELQNTSFSNYLVCYGGNRMKGSRFFLSIPNSFDIYSLKVQCFGEVKCDAYEKTVEDIIEYKPYLVFNDESDGLYRYSVVLPEVPEIFTEVSIDGMSVDVSFDKNSFVLTSSSDLSSYSGNYLLTLKFNTKTDNFKQTYICPMEVR